MHREIVVYYVLALDPNGDLAAGTRNRKAYARAFRHSSLELCYLSSTNASTRSWSGPIIGGSELPHPLYRLIEADPAAAGPHSDGGVPSVLEGKKVTACGAQKDATESSIFPYESCETD
jgi:hypothetical protein